MSSTNGTLKRRHSIPPVELPSFYAHIAYDPGPKETEMEFSFQDALQYDRPKNTADVSVALSVYPAFSYDPGATRTPQRLFQRYGAGRR